VSGKGWIAVDLDATLAHYDGWKGPDHIGAPIPAMVERVKRWRAEGIEVRIFTARIWGGGDQRDVEQVRAAIERWCAEHIGEVLPVTNVKDWSMRELWDDRCVQVAPNTGEPVGARLLALLKEARGHLRADRSVAEDRLAEDIDELLARSAP
jgi:hypothetical protein